MTMRMLSSWNLSSSRSAHYAEAIYLLKGMKNQYWQKFKNSKSLMSQLWKQWKSWRNHQSSSCNQKNSPKSRDLYYLEERSTSQRTSNFNWKSSSYIMIHQLQDIQDNERHWSWLHIIIGGLVLPCRSRTMYQDVTVVKEWSLFQKSLSPMKLPHKP